MSSRFDSFVLFAEMRTGSNFLEENLNLFADLTCHGEVFNPHFLGQHNRTDLFGIDMAMREADPIALIDRMKERTEGLSGFRYFHDHDPRVLDAVLNDQRCAKVILTRNQLDSYVSRKIAISTNQWRLTDVKHRKDAKAEFDLAEFSEFLDELQAFQLKLQRGLQVSGQSAFYISYDDIGELDVLNGLARFIGSKHELSAVSERLKRQNPAPLSEKVSNFAEMQDGLATLDRFDLNRTPNFEPRRGPGVPTFVAAKEAPVLFIPVKGVANDRVVDWLAALDDVGAEALQRGFSQKTLRRWKNQNKKSRSFSVVTHPAERAHDVFVRYILSTGPDAFSDVRRALRTTYKHPLPKEAPDESFSAADHRAAFLGFLAFVKANLAGQTSLRCDPAWATQSAILQGVAEFIQPDFVFRSHELTQGLEQLCLNAGIDSVGMPDAAPAESAVRLHDIYDETVEEAVRSAYNRDYMIFGYGPWSG